MKKLMLYLMGFICVSCSSTNKPEYIKADDEPLIYMSTESAPVDCKLLGHTSGPFETYTAGNPKMGKNLHQVHISKAQAMGGNYLEKDHTKGMGKVYLCPEKELLKMEEATK